MTLSFESGMSNGPFEPIIAKSALYVDLGSRQTCEYANRAAMLKGPKTYIIERARVEMLKGNISLMSRSSLALEFQVVIYIFKCCFTIIMNKHCDHVHQF